MESRIPLPTDNIYKFFALFGLLLVVFFFGAIIYVNNHANNVILEAILEASELIDSPKIERNEAEELRLKLIEKRAHVANEDRDLYAAFLGLPLFVGLLFIVYGFHKWHSVIQPNQDEITRLTIKKLKQEVGENDE